MTVLQTTTTTFDDLKKGVETFTKFVEDINKKSDKKLTNSEMKLDSKNFRINNLRFENTEAEFGNLCNLLNNFVVSNLADFECNFLDDVYEREFNKKSCIFKSYLYSVKLDSAKYIDALRDLDYIQVLKSDNSDFEFDFYASVETLTTETYSLSTLKATYFEIVY